MAVVRSLPGRPPLRQWGSRWVGLSLFSGVLSVLLCLVSLAVGSHSLTLEEVAGAFVPGRTTVASVIVWQLRMPRTVLAVMVGASLAVAGVVMQGLTRNPLAEPGILGINAGASLSVVLSHVSAGADQM